MPDKKYAGSESGTGNPPGQYSKNYLKEVKSDGHFIEGKSYRGGMHVGVPASASDGGNKVRSSKSSTLESFTNKEMAY